MQRPGVRPRASVHSLAHKKRQKNPQLFSRRIGLEIQRGLAPGKQSRAESQRISAVRQKLNETLGAVAPRGGALRLTLVPAQTASSLSHVATQKCGAAYKICASMDGLISGQESRAAAPNYPPALQLQPPISASTRAGVRATHPPVPPETWAPF